MLWNGSWQRTPPPLKRRSTAEANPEHQVSPRDERAQPDVSVRSQSNLTPPQAAAALWPRIRSHRRAHRGQDRRSPDHLGHHDRLTPSTRWSGWTRCLPRRLNQAANGGHRSPQIDYLADSTGTPTTAYAVRSARPKRLTKYGKPFWITEAMGELALGAEMTAPRSTRWLSNGAQMKDMAQPPARLRVSGCCSATPGLRAACSPTLPISTSLLGTPGQLIRARKFASRRCPRTA